MSVAACAVATKAWTPLSNVHSTVCSTYHVPYAGGVSIQQLRWRSSSLVAPGGLGLLAHCYTRAGDVLGWAVCCSAVAADTTGSCQGPCATEVSEHAVACTAGAVAVRSVRAAPVSARFRKRLRAWH